jgi:hypothetical protein
MLLDGRLGDGDEVNVDVDGERLRFDVKRKLDATDGKTKRDKAANGKTKREKVDSKK